MQLRLPWTAPPAAGRTIEAGGRILPVEIARHRRARRYILRVTSAGVVRVTVPRGASIAGGLAFARGQADWIAIEWARREARAAWEAHWRDEAVAELPDRCRTLGDPHGLRPARIHVRNQQSRWGSCSTRGTITLNWRLVQMPAEVADYVMLHELAHLEHPDHSTRFWRRVAVICPWWRSAERWLRTYGRELL